MVFVAARASPVDNNHNEHKLNNHVLRGANMMRAALEKRHCDKQRRLRENSERYSIFSGGRLPVTLSKHAIQSGRYRKRKAFDCGNAQCWCHGDKYPKRNDGKEKQRLSRELAHA